MQALVSLSLSLLSKFANSLIQKMPNQIRGKQAYHVSERPTLRPMPRKNIIEP